MAAPYQKALASLLLVACSGRSHDDGRAAASAPHADAAAAARPLDPARLDALARVTIAGDQVSVVHRGDRDLAAVVTGPGGERATVTVSACLGCVAMDVAAWRARQAELAALYAPRGDAGGDHLAIEAVAVGGRTAIAVRATRVDDSGTYALDQLQWNDGATQIAVVCERFTAADAAAAPSCAPLGEASMAAYLAALL